MKLTLSKSILLFTLVVANFLSAQRIVWSPEYKGNKFGSFVYADKGKDFYTLTFGASILSNSRFLTRYEDFSKGEAKKISYKVDGGTGSFNDMIVVDGKVVVFITDRKNGMYKLYYQVYNKKCMPETEPELVIEYKSPKGFKRGDYFNIIQSKNKKYFVVEYAVPGNKTENDRYGYKIFDDSFEMTGEGEYESPYGSKESDITNRYISNTGDLFVGIKVYNTNSKGRVRDFSSLKKYIICFIKGDDLEEMDLDFKEKIGGIGKLFYPTGDIEKDMKEIQQFYSGKTGKNKQQFESNTVRIKQEQQEQQAPQDSQENQERDDNGNR